jgi:hypothetical protein
MRQQVAGMGWRDSGWHRCRVGEGGDIENVDWGGGVEGSRRPRRGGGGGPGKGGGGGRHKGQCRGHGGMQDTRKWDGMIGGVLILRDSCIGGG